jgi:outer membrane immunogenic protein
MGMTNRRELLLAGAALCTLMAPAVAADMLLKAPPAPPAPPVFNWTGYYIGASGGYAWGDSDAVTAVAARGTPVYFVPTDLTQIASSGMGTIHPKGGVGGAQSGYNWQSGNVVYGLEVDFSAFSTSDARSVTTTYISVPTTSFTVNQSVKTDWLFTARPRLGWANNNWLWYATGGLAVTELKYGNTFTDTYSPAFETGSISNTKVGWTVGGGGEFALSNDWTVRAEYLYVDFSGVSSAGNVSNSVTTSGTPPVLTHSANLTANIIRGGINYRF